MNYFNKIFGLTFKQPCLMKCLMFGERSQLSGDLKAHDKLQ